MTKNMYIKALAVVGGLALGEYVQPVDKVKELIQYHNVPIAKNFPADPWNYSLQREIIETEGKTYQGLYLVNEKKDIHKMINNEGCTCTVGNSIDEFVQDAKTWVGEKVQAGKEWLNKDD